MAVSPGQDIEQGYRVLMHTSMEGMACIEFDPPIPVDAPTEEQIDLGYSRARHVEWNSVYAAQYGYAADDDLYEVKLDAHLPRADERNLDCLRNFVHNGYECHGGETFERDRTGSPRVFLNSWTGIVDNNELARMWVIMMETTTLKATERALRQAQKMEAIGQLTGGIAHDFNNILASVIGYTELVLDDPRIRDSRKLSGYLREAHDASLRARDLVAQLLSFSRRQGGNSRLIDPEQPVKGVVRLLRPTFPATMALRVRAQEQLPQISIDPVQLEQVLLNLCINARDAMRANGEIDIRLSHVPDASMRCASCQQQIGGESVVIAIEDTGSGIPEKSIGRIFEPFYSSKDISAGSGLGLAMADNITHAHDGHIEVESVVGQGTVFRLVFPAAQAEAAAAKAASAARPSRRGAELTARVLVVDDQQSVGTVLCQLLESRGFGATLMNDGREALRYFEAHRGQVDLVITDHVMPGLSGAEFARMLLRIEPALPIILCSGYAADIDERRARAIGIRGYQAKPFEVEDLFTTIHELLGSS